MSPRVCGCQEDPQDFSGAMAGRVHEGLLSNFRAAGFLKLVRAISLVFVGARYKHLGYKTSEASP